MYRLSLLQSSDLCYVCTVHVGCTDCPGVTAGAVRSLLADLTHLTRVTLGPGLDGAVTEVALDGLRGCSKLRELQLGTKDQPVTDVPAAAVGRSVSRHWPVCV